MNKNFAILYCVIILVFFSDAVRASGCLRAFHKIGSINVDDGVIDLEPAVEEESLLNEKTFYDFDYKTFALLKSLLTHFRWLSARRHLDLFSSEATLIEAVATKFQEFITYRTQRIELLRSIKNLRSEPNFEHGDVRIEIEGIKNKVNNELNPVIEQLKKNIEQDLRKLIPSFKAMFFVYGQLNKNQRLKLVSAHNLLGYVSINHAELTEFKANPSSDFSKAYRLVSGFEKILEIIADTFRSGNSDPAVWQDELNRLLHNLEDESYLGSLKTEGLQSSDTKLTDPKNAGNNLGQDSSLYVPAIDLINDMPRPILEQTFDFREIFYLSERARWLSQRLYGPQRWAEYEILSPFLQIHPNIEDLETFKAELFWGIYYPLDETAFFDHLRENDLTYKPLVEAQEIRIAGTIRPALAKLNNRRQLHEAAFKSLSKEIQTELDTAYLTLDAWHENHPHLSDHAYVQLLSKNSDLSWAEAVTRAFEAYVEIWSSSQKEGRKVGHQLENAKYHIYALIGSKGSPVKKEKVEISLIPVTGVKNAIYLAGTLAKAYESLALKKGWTYSRNLDSDHPILEIEGLGAAQFFNSEQGTHKLYSDNIDSADVKKNGTGKVYTATILVRVNNPDELKKQSVSDAFVRLYNRQTETVMDQRFGNDEIPNQMRWSEFFEGGLEAFNTRFRAHDTLVQLRANPS